MSITFTYHRYILYKAHNYFSTKPNLFSTQFLLPLRETLWYTGSVKLFAEGSQLFTHAVFQLVVVRETAFLVSNHQRPKKIEV